MASYMQMMGDILNLSSKDLKIAAGISAGTTLGGVTIGAIANQDNRVAGGVVGGLTGGLAGSVASGVFLNRRLAAKGINNIVT